MDALLSNTRKTLHRYPELSGQEVQTSLRIINFIKEHHPPSHIIDQIGGHGLVSVYASGQDGSHVMFRCELDALPIHEKNDMEHQSVYPNIGHKCGHDGHIAIALGTILWLKDNMPKKGTVSFLFQPAEETGQGGHLNSLNVGDLFSKDFQLATPVCLEMGQKAFGISPGNGSLHYTIRAWSDEQLEVLKDKIKTHIEEVCVDQRLDYNLEWFEYFPSSINHQKANDILLSATQSASLDLVRQKHPFTFGEDFGWYSKKYNCAMFGLGAGINTFPLHHESYDFPDELIPTGTKIFSQIIKEILA